MITKPAPNQQTYAQSQYPPISRPIMYQPTYHHIPPQNKSRIVAGILAIFLGGLGIHKFYLEKFGNGIIYLIFCWTLIPSLFGIIEGIMYLSESDEAFQERVRDL